MYIVLTTIALLASCFCPAIGRSTCVTPNGINGTCIRIDRCRSVLKIVKSVNLTQQNLEFLKKSQCGLVGTTPKVCCPIPCKTPASGRGTCMSIHSCPSIAKLLQPPLTMQNLQYVQDSRCPRSQEETVCCPLGPQNKSIVAAECAATINAFPTDPNTECCGVESVMRQPYKGGAKTTIYQYPWLVALEYFYENIFEILATGSLISSRYVLTAGQTMAGFTISRFNKPVSVRLGEYETTNAADTDCVLNKNNIMECNNGMIRIEIEHTIPHPYFKADWQREVVHDIGLVRLKQNAPFTDFIRPICLPTIDLTIFPPDNFTLFVAGWGQPNPNEKSSKVKLHVDVPLVDRDQCQEAYWKRDIKTILKSGHICAGGVVGKGTCSGDAGAPLMYQNGKAFQVLGVVSFGATPCGRATPGVYTKVYEYLPWIRRTINDDYKLFANVNSTKA